MLAHVPSFGRNPRGSPDFLAYPVLKACMHVLGTGVPRRLGVARSSSSPKAAQALGSSLTPGLRISFGRVTCMARAASVPGLWTLSFLLLCGACVWIRVMLGLGFRLRPATPGWADGVCVFLRARSACTPPLLAGVCGVGVWAWARVSATPRHSWLGCRGVCVLVCALRLYPSTPGWCVRGGCVCLGSGFGCAPPLLARLMGCVCACVRTLLVPCHSWLGCAVWVCVLGLGFRLCPATPGWGVGVCVCLCARSACTPPLVAGVCGVNVCVWARVSAAPRHSWLGCWGVCVLVRAPLVPRHSLLVGVCGVGVCAWARLLAAPYHSWLGCWDLCVCLCGTPLVPRHSCSGVRCGCVCLGLGFGCAPPLLAGVSGCVCACVRPGPPPRHSWLGCAVWVCVFGLGFRLRPPILAGLTRCVCLCAHSACTPPLLAGVCGVGLCAWARVSAAPRHSWLGCWGVCVLVCALRLYPATPGWGVRCGCVCLGFGFGWAPATPGWADGVCVLVCALCLYPPTPGWDVRCGCVCLGSGFGCASPLLAGVLGCVCACLRAPLVPCHSWLGCAVWVCVFGFGFRLRPATSGWGVGVCVCLCAHPACTPPFFAGWGVRCGCVCLGSGFGCAPPLLAGVFGCVCACVCPPLEPRYSWLGCAVWVFVLGLGFRLRPATPGWGLGVCVCFCEHSACAPPLLAGMCGVGVRAWARVLAAPRHSWPGCWGVRALVCALRLHPATPGWCVRCGCVGLGSGFGCAPPLLAGVLRCVCACVRTLLVPRHC